jgi:hypothetical protein
MVAQLISLKSVGSQGTGQMMALLFKVFRINPLFSEYQPAR